MPSWTDIEQFKSQLFAVFSNIYDWFVIGVLKQKTQSETEIADIRKSPYCILIQRPGSIHQIVYHKLQDDECTVGYNVNGYAQKNNPIIKFKHEDLPDNAVLLKTKYFSVNYADVCIRWGLYDSANKYVGWPICPGFDVSGEIEWAGKKTGLKPGDKVFGCSFFGGYSSRVLIPSLQIRKLPNSIAVLKDSLSRAAAIPAVACTALHALNLAGFWPKVPPLVNKGILVHSAAGGVGTMLCCLAKHMGASPVVGVVGREEKLKDLKSLKTAGGVLAVDYAIQKKDLWVKADVVANKKNDNHSGASEIAQQVNSMDFAAIFDANGVETLQKSYDNLAQSGRLIIYGFHTNLPRSPTTNSKKSGTSTLMISPLLWLKILWAMLFGGMPRFDPMLLTVTSKAVMGFNLSFFTTQIEMMSSYFDALEEYAEQKVIPSDFSVLIVDDVREGHELLSTGNSVGKIVVSI